MFDWLGDIFNSDTFDTLSSGFKDFAGAAKTAAPYVQGGLSLLGGLEGMRNQRNLRNARANTVQQLQDIFSPSGDYAQELRRQLERRDAASGRRSQYGNRETELMANLAKTQSGVLTNPQYAANLVGANTSAYGPLMGALGKLFQQQQQAQAEGSKKKNTQTPPGTQKALDYLTDSLFSTTPDVSISSLGGAQNALAGANTPSSLGTPDLLGSLSGNEAYLPTYDSGSNAGGIFSGYGSSTAGNLSAAEGIGGAGSSLAGGVGSGALGGSVGGADTLGALFGGTGYLPGYAAAGGEAGAGLFGSAAGAGAAEGAGAAGAGAAGGLGSAGAAEGAGALGGAGGAGLAAGAVALPFALAIGGMLNGIFGSPDGPPGSYRDIVNEAAGQTWNPDTGSIASDITDWVNQRGGMDMQHKYYTNDIGDVDKYMREKYGAPTLNQSQGLGGWSDAQYQEAYNNYFQPRFLANQPTWLSQRE